MIIFISTNSDTLDMAEDSYSLLDSHIAVRCSGYHFRSTDHDLADEPHL